MKHGTRAYFALLAAVVGLPLLGQSAMAQQRVGTDGHAADANPMVGSNGYNTPNSTTSTWLQSYQAYQNNIATGDVTRGQAFSGRTVNGVNLGAGYTDPFAFRGLLAGQGVDQFIASSTGVPTMANPTASSQQLSAPPQTFYGQANHNMPPGYQPLSNAPGYIPETAVTQQPQDTRIGEVIPPEDVTVLPKPDELFLPGQVDPTSNTTQFFAASPLFGVRPWDMTGQNSNIFSPANGEQNGSVLPNGAASTYIQHLTPSRVMELRTELSNESGTGLGSPSPQPVNTGAKLLKPLGPGATSGQDQPLPPLTPAGGAVQQTNLSPAAGNVSFGETNPQGSNGSLLPAPQQQSTQYAQLQQRLRQYNAAHPTMTDQQANQQFQAFLQQQPGTAPGGLRLTTPAAGERPMQIDSIATGIRARGLAEIIGNAERLVLEQKYDHAISVYDDAVSVAPNNPLILMGRAEAELGGGYYGRADGDLHAAFSHEQALFVSQYDLEKHFGRQRVQAIVDDLKKFAADSPNNPTPAFLLGYVYYNTHRESQAATWVDAADKRSGGKDLAIPLMKKYWNFIEAARVHSAGESAMSK